MGIFSINSSLKERKTKGIKIQQFTAWIHMMDEPQLSILLSSSF